jgi:hypothetical protein
MKGHSMTNPTILAADTPQPEVNTPPTAPAAPQPEKGAPPANKPEEKTTSK